MPCKHCEGSTDTPAAPSSFKYVWVAVQSLSGLAQQPCWGLAVDVMACAAAVGGGNSRKLFKEALL